MVKTFAIIGGLTAVIIYNVVFYLVLFTFIGGFYVYNTPNRIRRAKQ